MRASLLLIGLSLLALAACDGSPPVEHPESCQNIIDVCHDVDDGMDSMITECHDTAHDEGTAAACDPIEADCVSRCEAAAHTDGGSEHDGGH